jgi:hypothetical protein
MDAYNRYPGILQPVEMEDTAPEIDDRGNMARIDGMRNKA